MREPRTLPVIRSPSVVDSVSAVTPHLGIAGTSAPCRTDRWPLVIFDHLDHPQALDPIPRTADWRFSLVAQLLDEREHST